MATLRKNKALLLEPLYPVLFSGIDTWNTLKSNSFEDVKKGYPWHLCIEARLDLNSNQLVAFNNEILLHDNIETHLDSRLNEKIDCVKLFSLIEERYVKHYWQLAQPLERLTFSDIILLNDINSLKSISYNMSEDKNWRIATNKIEMVNIKSEIFI